MAESAHIYVVEYIRHGNRDMSGQMFFENREDAERAATGLRALKHVSGVTIKNTYPANPTCPKKVGV